MTSGCPSCQDLDVLPVLRGLCVHAGDQCCRALRWARPSQSGQEMAQQAQASCSQPRPRALGITLTVARGRAKDPFGGR